MLPKSGPPEGVPPPTTRGVPPGGCNSGTSVCVNKRREHFWEYFSFNNPRFYHASPAETPPCFFVKYCARSPSIVSVALLFIPELLCEQPFVGGTLPSCFSPQLWGTTFGECGVTPPRKSPSFVAVRFFVNTPPRRRVFFFHTKDAPKKRGGARNITQKKRGRRLFGRDDPSCWVDPTILFAHGATPGGKNIRS